MKIVKSKEEFLQNHKNKQRFINLLAERLANSGCKVLRAQDDADVLVVQTAVSCAETSSTTLIGNDTDLLVLLLYHAKFDACDIFMQTDTHGNNQRSYDIKRIKSELGTEAAENLLICHAMSGCDTTSRLHGVGKPAVVSLSLKDVIFKNAGKIFMTPGSSHQRPPKLESRFFSA